MASLTVSHKMEKMYPEFAGMFGKSVSQQDVANAEAAFAKRAKEGVAVKAPKKTEKTSETKAEKKARKEAEKKAEEEASAAAEAAKAAEDAKKSE